MRTRRELAVPGMDARSSLSPPSYTSLTVTGIFQTNCGTPYPIISSREQEPQVLALSSACHVAVARNLFILQLFQSFLNFHTIEVESCCCCFSSFCSLSLPLIYFHLAEDIAWRPASRATHEGHSWLMFLQSIRLVRQWPLLLPFLHSSAPGYC